MKTKLGEYVKDGNIVIPLYILKCFKKFDLTMEEFVFLMYLYNKQDKIDFNPEKISKDLNIDIMEVMGYISVLTDKGFLTLDIIKDNDILDEVINLQLFYEKISLLFMEENPSSDKEDIFKYIESALGRGLNSLEIEMINGWIKNKINSDLIKEAVNIAINDGVFSLKYIDRIIFDFKNRGITNVKEIKDSYMASDDNKVESDNSIDDWNWLDDDEEYIAN